MSEKESVKEKLLVVVDPNKEEQIALHRAIVTAKQRSVEPSMYIFVGIDHESVDMRLENDKLFRDQTWFEDVIKKPLEDAGLEYLIEVSWCGQWQRAIQQASNRFGADTIYLPVRSKTTARRFSFSETKWELLKISHCPVLLVRPGAVGDREVVLAAVNYQAQGDQQQLLNQKILERGKLVASRYGAEFHVVNAYVDSMLYPDRGKLAKETGLPADRIHVRQGYTDEVVSAVAKEVKADVAVIGTLGQTGRESTTRRGNTAARVIAALDCDVMVFNQNVSR